MINVWGDSIGAGVVAHLSRREVEETENKIEKDEKIEILSPGEKTNAGLEDTTEL